jgi:hypothetical protein
MSDTHISAEMAGAVGRLLGRQVSFPIAESDIRKWALAVYHPEKPPRLFWDAPYAAATPYGGIVAPEEFNPFAWMPAESVAPESGGSAPGGLNDPNRTEASLGIPGPGLQFQVNGGIVVEYGVRMRPGDVITAESSLAGYTERQGSLGRMLFTSTESVWTNQAGELVKRSTTTVIRY